jgi:ribosomal protein L11 methyltransferase
MEWIEWIIHTTSEGSDPVSDLLIEFGASGTMIEDRRDIPDPSKPNGIWEIIDPKLLDQMPQDVLVHAWFEADKTPLSMMETFRNRLAELAAGNEAFGPLLLEFHSVNDSEWKEVWKQYFKPFYASEHLVIKPTWESFDPQPDDTVIEIDPGMAFGSGTHETTAMCLSLLEQTIVGGEEIIDVGTGSGILAIGAALLGAGHVLAVDIDPNAVKVASENVKNNHVDNLITVKHGNLLDHISAVCDICVANIISDVIISFAKPLKAHIRPGGLFICSGIVSSRADEVKQALCAAEYEIRQKAVKGEWVAFLCRRNS